MPRETSPYIVGDFWLDKRRDGKSPDVWQIAFYDTKARSVGYKSTRCREVEDARQIIDAHHARQISKQPQRADDALVVPLLLLFWDERGSKAQKPGQVASSLRQFIAFLDQDEATVGVTVAALNPNLFQRFQTWRTQPHSYSLEWLGKTYAHSSPGVRGESVQRNLDDVRWALSHHADNGRLPYAPKVPAVKKEFRSPPRDRVLTDEELGAIIGFARSDLEMLRFVLLQLGTAVRPEAAMKMDPAVQWKQEAGLLDLHPVDAPRTKKHNPVVPVIPELEPILEAWREDGAKPVLSKKKSWRTLRTALGLGMDVVPKTIRHTVATRLRSKGALSAEISSLLGHSEMKGSTAVYAKYDPNFLGSVKPLLSIIWQEAMAAADEWSAVHLRYKQGNNRTFAVARVEVKV